MLMKERPDGVVHIFLLYLSRFTLITQVGKYERCELNIRNRMAGDDIGDLE
jgi:hypothetical protein